eukprot:g47337.t1
MSPGDESGLEAGSGMATVGRIVPDQRLSQGGESRPETAAGRRVPDRRPSRGGESQTGDHHGKVSPRPETAAGRRVPDWNLLRGGESQTRDCRRE